MADRPTKLELLEAIQRFIDEELIEHLGGVRRFHARVSSNALGILRRELELEGGGLARRFEALRGLVPDAPATPGEPAALSAAVDELETRLVERIRAGEADEGSFRARVLDYLELSVAERLAVNNPGYA